MLRLQFTSEDLARTVISAEPDPMWEILLSGFRLRERSRPMSFRPWARALAASPSRAAAARSGCEALRVLAPLGPYFPDFLTPTDARDGLTAGLTALCGTPRRELGGQLEKLSRWKRLPVWVRPLADGDVTALTELATVLRTYHDATIEPHQEQVGNSVAADHAHRLRAFTTGGLRGVFTSMHPMVRWRPPVLEVDYAIDKEIHLHGRGLRIVPSYFCHRIPVALADPELPPTLVYPIDPRFRWPSATRPATERSLEALLGDTRSSVLRSVALGETTTGIARRLAISVSSVSRHAAVLRDAGFITSHRHDKSVRHVLTPLGAAVLENQRA
jgi:DNA-binding transcriptional ArsR family regulator